MYFPQHERLLQVNNISDCCGDSRVLLSPGLPGFSPFRAVNLSAKIPAAASGLIKFLYRLLLLVNFFLSKTNSFPAIAYICLKQFGSIKIPQGLN